MCTFAVYILCASGNGIHFHLPELEPFSEFERALRAAPLTEANCMKLKRFDDSSADTQQIAFYARCLSPIEEEIKNLIDFANGIMHSNTTRCHEIGRNTERSHTKCKSHSCGCGRLRSGDKRLANVGNRYIGFFVHMQFSGERERELTHKFQSKNSFQLNEKKQKKKCECDLWPWLIGNNWSTDKCSASAARLFAVVAVVVVVVDDNGSDVNSE